MQFRKIKGTNDYLPNESVIFRAVRNRVENIIEQFGFQYEITPILEPYELFIRSIGEQSDIVNKEMFVFTSKNGKKIALKPEETAVLYRSLSENNLLTNADIKKLFYFTPVFRYERPQKGRFREFYQYGVEIINSYNAERDGEIMHIGKAIIDSFEIKDVKLHINSIGCKKCRPEYKKALIDFLSKNDKNLCENCKIKIHNNPLRILDCKNKSCIEAVKNAPITIDYLCNDCAEHFNQVKESLDRRKIEYIENTNIVRGLDYYSSTVFEFIEEGGKLGSQSTIIGGGRYDYLSNEFDAENIGAVGFSGGFERLLISIDKSVKDRIIDEYSIKAVLVYFNDETMKYASNIADMMREANIKTEITFEYQGIKKQMKFASRINARFAIICGEEEMNDNKVKIKNMNTGKQIEVERNIDKIKEAIL